jgi:hypothetical protein
MEFTLIIESNNAIFFFMINMNVFLQILLSRDYILGGYLYSLLNKTGRIARI